MTTRLACDTRARALLLFPQSVFAVIKLLSKNVEINLTSSPLHLLCSSVAPPNNQTTERQQTKMALTTRNEIRDQILEEREYFERDSDRAISELAESLTPIYNADTIAEWSDLPMSQSDVWKEYGIDESATILERMRFDLWRYYDETAREVWAEIEEEHTCEKPATVSIESARFTGNTFATCSDCAFMSSLWDCACELEHDCADYQTAN